MAFTSTGFPAELIRDVFIGAKGKSSIAKLSGQTPIAFSGTDVMAFSLDGEVNLVAEGAAKASHTNSNDVINIVPVKIEYGARISDEFKRCSQEKKLNYIEGFADGFAGKIGRGLDIMQQALLQPHSSAQTLSTPTQTLLLLLMTALIRKLTSLLLSLLSVTMTSQVLLCPRHSQQTSQLSRLPVFLSILNSDGALTFLPSEAFLLTSTAQFPR